jgi:hypothetical protein
MSENTVVCLRVSCKKYDLRSVTGGSDPWKYCRKREHIFTVKA